MQTDKETHADRRNNHNARVSRAIKQDNWTAAIMEDRTVGAPDKRDAIVISNSLQQQQQQPRITNNLQPPAAHSPRTLRVGAHAAEVSGAKLSYLCKYIT